MQEPEQRLLGDFGAQVDRETAARLQPQVAARLAEQPIPPEAALLLAQLLSGWRRRALMEYLMRHPEIEDPAWYGRLVANIGGHQVKPELTATGETLYNPATPRR